MHFDSQNVARLEHESPAAPEDEVLLPTTPELLVLPDVLLELPEDDEAVAHASPPREALPSLQV